MNIGIKFKIPNEYGNYLKKILNTIDDTKYVWKIWEDEVYITDDNKNNGFLFPQEKEIFSNTEFIDIISQESYYTFFANIKLYEKDDGIAIKNYKDFLKSSCILVLLITDSEFVEVYSKEEKLVKVIYNNAVENEFRDISYIIKDN